MSDPRMDLLHRFYEAISRRDLATLRALGDQYPDYRWRPNEEDPEMTEFQSGRESLEQLLSRYEVFDELTTTIDDVVEDGGRLLLSVTHRARGRASGVMTERAEVHAWTFDGERPVQMVEFPSLEAARAG